MLLPDKYTVQDLTAEDLIPFLKQKGWVQRSAAENFVIFEGLKDDNGCPIQIRLPTSSSLRDYHLRILDVLQVLSAVENSSIEEIFRAIKEFERDTLRIRIVDPAIDFSSIPFERACSIMQQLRSLISYAACSEENPKPYFIKPTLVGRDFLNKCRFGQTAPGSFVFNIEAPIGLSVRTQSPSARPFSRRVMERIYKSIHLISQALYSGDFDNLTHPETGMNANICEALQGLLTPETEVIEYSMAWSSKISVIDELKHLKVVPLRPKAREYLDVIARQLREEPENEKITISGLVVELRSETISSSSEDDEGNSESEEEHVVKILFKDRQKRELRVKVSLPTELYHKALKAHADGKEISLTGYLTKVGKFWTLQHPQDFNVVEN